MKFISESELNKQSCLNSGNTDLLIQVVILVVNKIAIQIKSLKWLVVSLKKGKMWGSLCSSVKLSLKGIMMATVMVITTSLLQIPNGVAGNPPVMISQQKMVNVSGDFVLGAFFPIHKRGTAMDTCGEIQVGTSNLFFDILLLF